MNNKSVKFTYLLVTNDKYEFAISCCDTLSQMSKETGIPFNQLWDSYRKNITCSGGRYKLYKVDISEPDDNFTAQAYKLFCAVHNLKPSTYNNLIKFKRLCSILACL